MLLWSEEYINHSRRAGNHFVTKAGSRLKVFCSIATAEVLKTPRTIISVALLKALAQGLTNTTASATLILPKILVKELAKLGQWEEVAARLDLRY